MEPRLQTIALQVLYLHEMLEDEEAQDKWLLAIRGHGGWMRLERGPLGATPKLVELGASCQP